MMVVPQVLIICSLLFAAPATSAFVLSSSSSTSHNGSGVKNPSLLYDSIFDRHKLEQYVQHPNSIPALDEKTGDCLEAYLNESVRIAIVSGVKIRHCMQTNEQQIDEFLNENELVSQEYHDNFVKQMLECNSKSSKQALECNVDTIVMSLSQVNGVEPKNTPRKNRICLYIELGRLIINTKVANDHLKSCLLIEDPCANSTTLPPWNTTTPIWNVTTLPPWNNNTTTPKWNVTTLTPWHNTTTPKWNVTTHPPWINNTTTPHWNVTTLTPWHNTTTPKWNVTTSPPWNINTTTPHWNVTTTPKWNVTTLPPWNVTTRPPWNNTTTQKWNTTTLRTTTSRRPWGTRSDEANSEDSLWKRIKSLF